IKAGDAVAKSEYKLQFYDHLFLNLFRNKMVEEVGWDSEEPGYDGLIQVANRLMLTGRTNSDTKDAADTRSLFPPLLLDLYKMLISPIAGGKLAAVMTFFKDYMGVPPVMEPNFTDYSCQFGVLPPSPEDDNILKEPCLDICPIATRKRESSRN
ncbi:hypothetical protein Tsubulata_046916, partial [Turnera subulata]